MTITEKAAVASPHVTAILSYFGSLLVSDEASATSVFTYTYCEVSIKGKDHVAFSPAVISSREFFLFLRAVHLETGLKAFVCVCFCELNTDLSLLSAALFVQCRREREGVWQKNNEDEMKNRERERERKKKMGGEKDVGERQR